MAPEEGNKTQSERPPEFTQRYNGLIANKNPKLNRT